MKKTFLLTSLWLCLGVLAVVSCRHSAVETVTVNVPQMAGDRIVRIVTNAALDAIVGRYDGTHHEYEIDLTKKIVLYHESHKLTSPYYQRQIEARIRQVGFRATVLSAGFNPPPPVPTDKGLVQVWPNRFTAAISVPEMTSNTDANIVINAIAYARLGRDDPRISVKRDSRKVITTYEGMSLAKKNIEYAIACVGFNANAVPANLGGKDSVPYGWKVVKL